MDNKLQCICEGCVTKKYAGNRSKQEGNTESKKFSYDIVDIEGLDEY